VEHNHLVNVGPFPCSAGLADAFFDAARILAKA
jgi:hypothetical protein